MGVEPGIKPAAASSRNKRVVVMATTGTLRSPRVQQLVNQHAAGSQVLQLPCPGLAEAIEAAAADPAQLDARLDSLAADLRRSLADTVVLGCTHYPLVADALRQRLGDGVTLVDTAEAVARRVRSLLGDAAGKHAGSSASTARQGQLLLFSTADPAALQQAASRWLGGSPVASALALPDPVAAPLRQRRGPGLTRG